MKLRALLIILVFLFSFGAMYAQCDGCSDDCKDKESKVEQELVSSTEKSKIRFLEFGSVTCIPCKQMQPIMKSIEESYGSQIEVIFYDVNKQENREISKKYKIRLIPTQVFVDSNGKELHRHEGFYPENKIRELLASLGLKEGEK